MWRLYEITTTSWTFAVPRLIKHTTAAFAYSIIAAYELASAAKARDGLLAVCILTSTARTILFIARCRYPTEFESPLDLKDQYKGHKEAEYGFDDTGITIDHDLYPNFISKSPHNGVNDLLR